MLNRADRWASENRIREDLPNDNTLRVAQFIGNKMVSWEEVKPETPIRLALGPDSPVHHLTVYGSAAVSGSVKGSVNADGDVTCREIYGSVTADGTVNAAGPIRGSVTADGNVHCEGAIGGSVTADGDVTCGSVGASIRAEGDIHCGNVGGSVTSSDGNVKLRQRPGQCDSRWERKLCFCPGQNHKRLMALPTAGNRARFHLQYHPESRPFRPAFSLSEKVFFEYFGVLRTLRYQWQSCGQLRKYGR